MEPERSQTGAVEEARLQHFESWYFPDQEEPVQVLEPESVTKLRHFESWYFPQADADPAGGTLPPRTPTGELDQRQARVIPFPAPRLDDPAVGLLHPEVQAWIAEQGWPTLREVQSRCIQPVLDGRDVLACAPTASGKTEGAMLPIASRLLDTPLDPMGPSVVMVVPLKALINDARIRVGRLCEPLGIPVHAWHGDVSHSRKRRFREAPRGVLLVTPESIEAWIVRRGRVFEEMCRAVRFLVIDEVHTYLESERGAQIRSQLVRVEAWAGGSIPRVGLSATLASPHAAAEWLRPGGGAEVEVVVASPGVPPVVRAFTHRGGGLGKVARSILAGFDGRKAIVFANSRSDVEDLTVHLRRHVDGQAIQVLPHHGSLSAGIRHEAEAALRNSSGRVIAVATSSLELGLDIGEVDLVAQVGVPPSPSTLAQRLGRSGRREAPAHLHLHVHRRGGQGPTAALRPGLVQSVATLELVLGGELERGVEPMHGSTFVHQLLSMASSPGAGEGEVKDLLSRAFPFVAAADAAEVLHSVEERGLVWREGGRLGLTEAGATVVGRFTFYAAFQASSAYRVVWSGGEVGKLEGPPPQPGDRFALAGRAWLTLALHHGRRLVEVRPDDSGEPPWFLGSGIPVGDEVRRRMLDVYQGTDAPGWLDAPASEQLGEARTAFTRLALDRTRMVAYGPDVFLFPWRGDRVVRTIQRALALHGFRARVFDMCVVVRTERPDRVAQALAGLVRSGLPSPEALAPGGGRGEKFDRYLPPGVLARDRASRHIDIAGAAEALEEIVGFQTTSP